MNPIDSIKAGIINNEPYKLIARRVFLSFPTLAFAGKEDIEFEIRNDISEYFKVPIISIQVAGSSKTGYSPYKKREFISGESDLDIAVINNDLFNKYSEISHKATKGYTDLSKFPINRKTSENEINYFLNSLNNSFFRPDLMPNSSSKTEWFAYFNKLSNKYFKIFKSINAGIYASEYYFESKQVDCIQKFKKIG